MLVEHELTGGGAAGGEAKTIDYVVQTRFEKLEKNLTGDTLGAGSVFEEVAELTLEYTVGVFSFLLLAELETIL